MSLIDKYVLDNKFKIKVIPNASRTEFLEEKDAFREVKLKLYLKAAPEKGKANQEVIKFFKKEFGLRVEIKSGLKSREKTLLVMS